MNPMRNLWQLIFLLGLIGGNGLTSDAQAQALAFDGHTDLLWQQRRTGQTAFWFMRHAVFTWQVGEIQATGSSNWWLVGSADFNRDNAVDLLWHNPVSWENAIWLMHGTNRLAVAKLPTSEAGYAIVGTGDFDGDGWPDILWRHTNRFTLAVWFMNGTNYAQRVGWIKPPSDTNWVPTVVGDCNNDGLADMFLRHRQTGENHVWIMQGTNVQQELVVDREPDLEYDLVGAGRFSRTGNLDLLWHHRRGTNRVWLMQGPVRIGIKDLPAVVDPEWHLGGTGGYTNSPKAAALVASSPPAINLHWEPDVPRPKLKRKPAGESLWSPITAEEVSSHWTDTNVLVGKAYEYQIGDEYVPAGIDLPPVSDRGRVLLLVEESLTKHRNLLTEISRLQTNLVMDGWTVAVKPAPRHDDERWSVNPPHIAQVKSMIIQFYREAPLHTNIVFLLGHVAIPYSGSVASDGHVASPSDPTQGGNDHRGAWAADGYYGDIDSELWTDSIVGQRNLAFPECDNLPGDGKFDNSFFPSDVELGVGRVDFARLTCFQEVPSLNARQREVELLVQYLQKDHRYRQGELAFAPRILAGAFFNNESFDSMLSAARRHASRWFGMRPGTLMLGDLFLDNGNYLWGMMAGNGGCYTIQGFEGRFHFSWEAASTRPPAQAAFYLMQGSFFADWNLRTNNVLRMLLTPPDRGLGAMGFSCAVFHFHAERLGLGESMGMEWKRLVNGRRPVADRWLAFLGDPTLRLQVTPPPSALSAATGSKIQLQWQSPAEGIAGYWVFRSTNGLAGPWQRLTPEAIPGTTFTDDPAPVLPATYQVRALQRVVTGGGSFTNVSQGAMLHAVKR
jgi:hypothetical protein